MARTLQSVQNYESLLSSVTDLTSRNVNLSIPKSKLPFDEFLRSQSLSRFDRYVSSINASNVDELLSSESPILSLIRSILEFVPTSNISHHLTPASTLYRTHSKNSPPNLSKSRFVSHSEFLSDLSDAVRALKHLNYSTNVEVSASKLGVNSWLVGPKA